MKECLCGAACHDNIATKEVCLRQTVGQIVSSLNLTERAHSPTHQQRFYFAVVHSPPYAWHISLLFTINNYKSHKVLLLPCHFRVHPARQSQRRHLQDIHNCKRLQAQAQAGIKVCNCGQEFCSQEFLAFLCSSTTSSQAAPLPPHTPCALSALPVAFACLRNLFLANLSKALYGCGLKQARQGGASSLFVSICKHLMNTN